MHVYVFFVFLTLFVLHKPSYASEKSCLERASSYAMARIITVIREHNGRDNFNAETIELMNSARCAQDMTSFVEEHIKWDFSFCLEPDKSPTFPEFIPFENILSLFDLTSECDQFEKAYSRYTELSQHMTNKTLDSIQLCTQTFSLLQDYYKNCTKKKT
jgi:hypothetical protein